MKPLGMNRYPKEKMWMLRERKKKKKNSRKRTGREKKTPKRTEVWKTRK